VVVRSIARSAPVKNVAAATLWWSRLSAPARVCANRLTVLTIHRVVPDIAVAEYPFPDLCITPVELRQCVEFAVEHFDVGTVTEQLARLRTSTGAGKPLLAISFDDGQWDNHQFAAPILRDSGVRATFYVPVEHVEKRQLIWHDRLGFSASTLLQSREGQARTRKVCASFGLPADSQSSAAAMCEAAKALASPARQALVEALESEAAETPPPWSRMMSWSEIRDLSQSGHEIGSHSMSHGLLPQLGDAELEWELRESHDRLSAATGHGVKSFCYPNGSFDGRVLQAMRKGPYSNAVSTRIGLHTVKEDDYTIKRVYVDSRCFSRGENVDAGKTLAMRIFLSS
jgi:peptidoglycan/xylan/chitin deacetylase (PgdA/CDA1 family)